MTKRIIILISVLMIPFLVWVMTLFVDLYPKSSEVIVNIINEEEIENSGISKMILKMQPKLDPEVSILIGNSIKKYSKQYNLPPELIISLIERESTFRLILTSKPTKNSNKGCMGLMQINPLAHPEKLKKLGVVNGNIYHIDINIHLGCMILKEYYDKTKDIEKALTRYVGGKHPGYVKDILSSFANLTINKNKKESVKKEKKE